MAAIRKRSEIMIKNETRPINVLSLDGGGIRGLILLQVFPLFSQFYYTPKYGR